MKLLRRCSAPGVVVCLICRNPALLLGRLLVALLDVSSVAVAIVVRWRRALWWSAYVSRGVGNQSLPGLDARPLGFMWARYGHIEMFSTMPKWLYRLFDVLVSLGPISSRCHRAAAFVTRMGNFCSNLVRPARELRTLLIRVP
ncbi:hypothetical protein CDL15_Pgr024882 [Punica granatum]|uniref:Uncharacterized protein n=1 Tax=Punica granatum TaxID=22663 RepID=A0A218XEH8_PUNGR|nr:hypothetical protein CDL15_Pgr024882 [Punica granatum]